MKVSILTTAFILTAVMVFSPGPGRAADDTCDLGRVVLPRAARAFAEDQAKGLKLFIKARELCPTEPIFDYNLGLAYYQYGRMSEAADYLGRAVKNGGRPAWRNNYALALLGAGQAAGAEKEAEAAASAAGDNPDIAETLARARAANGHEVAALKGLKEFMAKGKGSSGLDKRYGRILDTALTRALEKVKAGNTGQGLAALAALSFDPKAERARILVMSRAGKGKEALAAAAAARKRFPEDSEIAATFDDVAKRVALGLYNRFKGGGQTMAVKEAKQLADAFPGAEPIRTAYNKLLDALLADASAIEVPAAVARAEDSGGVRGRADTLLASLAGAGGGNGGEVDLSVDVDENIPRGRKAGKFDVAVVIGNRRYQAAGVPDVDFAGRDAAMMKKYLVRTMGFDPGNIISAQDATLGTFNQIFGTEESPRGRLYNFVKPGRSRVFVYYVGHGAPDLKNGDAYFVPVEADPQYLATSGYRLATFYKNLDLLPANEVTVVIDACFSGNSSKGLLFKGVSSIVIRPRTDQKKPANAVVVASARAEQVSAWYPAKRHSLFTYYFLKGLGGGADRDHDRKITVGEMAAFLQDEVPYMARKLKGVEQQPTVSGSPDKVLAWLEK